MTKHISYRGKKVFVGIDVHRRNYVLVARCEGEFVERCQMDAIPQACIRYLKRRFKGAVLKTAYEASFCGFVLARELKAAGIDNIVVNAASIEVAANDRVKTDKRDARKLSIQLEANRLKGINIPSAEQELSRQLTRTREQLLRSRKRIMNQIRMKLHQFGKFPLSHHGVLSQKLVKQVIAEGLPETLELCIQSLLSSWQALNIEIRRLERAFLNKTAEHTCEQLYRSIPGMGKITARILATELGDLSQFPNERALFCFTGLTPCEYSTGDTQRRGHISRQGSSRLRHLLVEAAWRAKRKDADLKQVYQRIAARRGKKRAITAVARKLIGRARAVFNNGEQYETKPPLAA